MSDQIEGTNPLFRKPKAADRVELPDVPEAALLAGAQALHQRSKYRSDPWEAMKFEYRANRRGDAKAVVVALIEQGWKPPERRSA